MNWSSIIISLTGLICNLHQCIGLIHHANGTLQQQKQQQPRVNSTRIIKGLLLRGIKDAYEEVFSPNNNGSRKQLVPLDDIRNSDRYEGLEETDCNNLQQNQQLFSPLEVSPRQQSDTLLQDESFSDCENSPLAAPIDAYFFSNNDCNNQQQLITANSQSILSPNQTSWLLYLSGMIGMSFLNPLCCVLAMRYANPSILAPFSGLTLVWVILFSGVVVNEFPGRSQKMACVLIVLGEILVALFGDHTNEEDKSVDDVVSYMVIPMS